MNKFILSETKKEIIFEDLIYEIPINLLYLAEDNVVIYEIEKNIDNKENIGYGAFSIIITYKAINSKNEIAIKIYNLIKFKNKFSREKIKTEIDFYKSIDYDKEDDSKYICKYYGYYSDKNYTYIFLEKMKYDLYDCIFKYKLKLFKDYSEFKNFIKSIIKAIHYIHKKGYIYTDLKLENIMINNENNFKIIDFNCIVSKDIKHINTNIINFKGTIDYLPPEVFNKNKSFYNNYKIESDYWNLAILIYEIIFLKSFPYITGKNKLTFKNIKENMFNDSNISELYLLRNFRDKTYFKVEENEIDHFIKLFTNLIKTNPKLRKIVI